MRKMLAALAVVAVTFPGLAAADALVRKQSPYSVADTLDRLAKIVGEKGATVFARIDHAGGAAKIGSELRPTQTLIFGNPKLGTPIMQRAQEAGLDLPLRVLAYEAADGKVWLAYRAPTAMGMTHGLAIDAEETVRVAKAIDGLTNAAVAE